MVAELLRKAADELETHGWTRLKMQDEAGRKCMLGALNWAVFGDDWSNFACPEPTDEQRATWMDAQAALRQRLGVRSLTTWNDEPGRTAGTVIRTLRAVADAAAKS